MRVKVSIKSKRINATGGEDTVSLFAMVGSNAFWQFYAPFNLTLDPSFVDNYSWNIKIRQIDCSRQDSLKGNMYRLKFTNEYNLSNSFGIKIFNKSFV